MGFGDYIKNLRKKQNFTIGREAKILNISASYLSSLERGLRGAPTMEVLERFCELFKLTKTEKEKLYDLAAETKKPPAIADDIAMYIFLTPQIREMLRYLMKCNLTEDDLNNINKHIKKTYFIE